MGELDTYPPFLTVPQVMELTQLGRSQVYKLMEVWDATDGAEGIPFVRFGRCKRIPKAALLALGSDLHAVA